MDKPKNINYHFEFVDTFDPIPVNVHLSHPRPSTSGVTTVRPSAATQWTLLKVAWAPGTAVVTYQRRWPQNPMRSLWDSIRTTSQTRTRDLSSTGANKKTKIILQRWESSRNNPISYHHFFRVSVKKVKGWMCMLAELPIHYIYQLAGKTTSLTSRWTHKQD